MILLLFDIDGTLLLCGPAPKVAFNAAFEEMFGMDDCWGNTRAHGNTDPLIVRDICTRMLGRQLTASENTQLCESYFRKLEKELVTTDSFRLMPGVTNLCQKLSEHPDLRLGLETGNFETSARLKLGRGKLNQYFPIGGFASDSSDRAEIIQAGIAKATRYYQASPFPNSCVYVVGDAPQDIIAGNKLGLPTIAVATGRSSSSELSAHNPSHLLEDLSDTNGFLQLLDL